MAKKVSFSSGNIGIGDFGGFFGGNDTDEERKNETHFEEVSLEEIKFDPKNEFQNLFPLDEENIKNIAEDIKKKGFVKSQCVTLISIEDEGEDYFVGDGHNRVEAAKRAGIEKIPVYRQVFATRKEAKIAMLDLQLKRRNLTDALKMKTVALYQELLGKSSRGEGKLSAKIAEAAGIGERTVQKMQAVLNSGDDELIDDVLSEKKSGNKAYNELKGKSKKQKRAKFDDDDDFSDSDDDGLSDALEDTSGEPHGLNITDHSDGIERPYKAPFEEDETDRWINEKNIQVEEARKEGFADGFRKALYFALGETLKGRTPKEIYNDEKLKDLGKDVIPSFVLPDGDEDAVLELGE